MARKSHRDPPSTQRKLPILRSCDEVYAANFDRLVQWIWRTCEDRGLTKADAEDMVSEVFAKLVPTEFVRRNGKLSKRESDDQSYESIRHPLSYIRVVLIRHTKATLRRRRAERDAIQRFLHAIREEKFAAKWLERCSKVAEKCLNTQELALFRAYHLARRYTLKELAELRGESHPAMRQQASRVTRKLQQALQPDANELQEGLRRATRPQCTRHSNGVYRQGPQLHAVIEEENS